MSLQLNLTRAEGYRAIEDDELEEPQVVSSRLKVLLSAAAILVSSVALYLFCVVLPNAFIPKLITLKEFTKVERLNITFHPLTQAGHFGVTDRFAKLQRVVRIPSQTKDRLILIGDIHGLYKQLRKLLKKIHFDSKRDEVLVLGDFIAKGPDSLKVLEFLDEVDARCIIGNHEFYVLQMYAQFHSIDGPRFHDDTVPFAPFSFNDDPEFLLAKKLQPKHVEYINKCLLIKTLGNVPLNKESKNGAVGGHKSAFGVAVHAGLRWDLSDLQSQNPSDCMEMRSYLPPFYNVTTSSRKDDGAILWLRVWNDRAKNGTIDPVVVYYGHDAGRGLNIKKFTKGLDSGCVKGGKLSALVLWQQKVGSDLVYKLEIAQVRC